MFLSVSFRLAIVVLRESRMPTRIRFVPPWLLWIPLQTPGTTWGLQQRRRRNHKAHCQLDPWGDLELLNLDENFGNGPIRSVGTSVQGTRCWRACAMTCISRHRAWHMDQQSWWRQQSAARRCEQLSVRYSWRQRERRVNHTHVELSMLISRGEASLHWFHVILQLPDWCWITHHYESSYGDLFSTLVHSIFKMYFLKMSNTMGIVPLQIE